MHKKTKRSQPLCENRVQLPKDFSFNWYEALLIIVLALFYLADILTDCNVAYTHYKIMIEASLRSTNSSSQLSYYDNNTDYVELMNGTSTDEHDDDYDAYHQWSVIVQLCFSFIIIPSLVVSGISARLYYEEMKRPTDCCYTRPSKALWTARIICLFLFISPVERLKNETIIITDGDES